MQWSQTVLNATSGTFALVNSASGRCLGLRPYTSSTLVPLLVPCATVAEDPTQEVSEGRGRWG